jgi:hypothetical protein
VAIRDFASGYARHFASGYSKFRQWLSTTTAEEIYDNNQNHLTKASNSAMNQVRRESACHGPLDYKTTPSRSFFSA